MTDEGTIISILFGVYFSFWAIGIGLIAAKRALSAAASDTGAGYD